MSDTGMFAKDTLVTLMARAAALVLGLGSSILIARLLGPEAKGLYALAMLLPALIMSVTNLGTGTALVYHVAKGRHSRDTILGTHLLLAVAIGAGSVTIGLLIVFFFSDWVLPSVPRPYLLFALAVIPVTLVVGNLQIIFRGLQRFRAFNAATVVQPGIRLLLVAVALWGLGGGVPSVIGASILTLVMMTVWLFWWARRAVGGISWRPRPTYLKAALSFGLQAHAGNTLRTLHSRLDMLILGALTNPAAVGFYSIAVLVSERLLAIPAAANLVLYPRVAAETDEKSLKAFTPLVCRHVLWITVVLASLAYVVSHWLVVLLFSARYLPAVRPLQILLPGIVFLGTSRVLWTDIAGRGRPMLNTYSAGIGLAINVALNLILIPRYGITGAALATTISYGVTMASGVFIYCWISGNSPREVLLLQRSDWTIGRRMGVALARWAKGRGELAEGGQVL